MLPPPRRLGFLTHMPSFYWGSMDLSSSLLAWFLLHCTRVEPGSLKATFLLSWDRHPAKDQHNMYCECFCALELDKLGQAMEEPCY